MGYSEMGYTDDLRFQYRMQILHNPQFKFDDSNRKNWGDTEYEKFGHYLDALDDIEEEKRSRKRLRSPPPPPPPPQNRPGINEQEQPRKRKRGLNSARLPPPPPPPPPSPPSPQNRLKHFLQLNPACTYRNFKDHALKTELEYFKRFFDPTSKRKSRADRRKRSQEVERLWKVLSHSISRPLPLKSVSEISNPGITLVEKTKRMGYEELRGGPVRAVVAVAAFVN